MIGQKTVWVTGASSGLGLHTATALKEDGWRVIAGARSFEDGEKDGIHRLKLDVTDEESIRCFCRKAKEIALPDALVQCAGMLVLGSCEETGVEEFHRVIDTNYLGMVRMNKAVLPLMRAQAAGKSSCFHRSTACSGFRSRAPILPANTRSRDMPSAWRWKSDLSGSRSCWWNPETTEAEATNTAPMRRP